jgi:hypothetical protein
MGLLELRVRVSIVLLEKVEYLSEQFVVAVKVKEIRLVVV